MTPEKQKQKLAGQTGIAQKIFQHVPVAEEWTAAQIGQAMMRATGSRVDSKTLGGCLMTMVDSSLVRATNRGTFQRVAVSTPAKPIIATKKESYMTKNSAEPAATTSAIDLLAGFSQKLRDMAAEVEAAALTIEESQSKTAADVAKLKMLKELFTN